MTLIVNRAWTKPLEKCYLIRIKIREKPTNDSWQPFLNVLVIPNTLICFGASLLSREILNEFITYKKLQLAINVIVQKYIKTITL